VPSVGRRFRCRYKPDFISIAEREKLMIALLVTIDIKPEYKERFMEELMLDAIGANDVEPGCLRFDVLQDNEAPNRVHLYEVYKDEAAIAAHREAPHFVKWRDMTKDWLAKPYSRTLCTNVYPSDEGWR